MRLSGRQLTYGVFDTEEDAFGAQARWRLSHLLPADDPEALSQPSPNAVAGGVRCSEWFERWQDAKRDRRSLVRVGGGRGGAESTAARDYAQWATWWAPSIGDRLPQTIDQSELALVLREMESAGRAPNTIRTHWTMIRAFFDWLVSAGILLASPADGTAVAVEAVGDRVREVVVPDFRFLDLLADRLMEPDDQLIFELLLGTGGRRSEVAGMRVGDVDLASQRVWVREPVVEVEGRRARNPTPKSGRDPRRNRGPSVGRIIAQPAGPDGKLLARHTIVYRASGWWAAVGKAVRLR